MRRRNGTKKVKYGIDFGVPVPKPTLFTLLFTYAGLPGLLVKLFAVTFLNLSIFSVVLVGFFFQPSLTSAGILLMALVTFWLVIRVSHMWSNLSVLSAVEEHLSRYGHCRFEILSNPTFQQKYGFRLPFELVNDLNEVKTFFGRITRPNKEYVAQAASGKGLKSLGPKLLSQAVSLGYQFIITLHPNSRLHKPLEFSTFASRDFGFAFLPMEKYGLTPLRQFCIAHELGHMVLPSTSRYFKSEGMMRCIIAIPFLSCCLTATPLSVGIILAIFGFYFYLRYRFYPSKMSAAYFRDEVFADRFAVAAVPLANLENISEGALTKFVKGDSNVQISVTGARKKFSSTRELSDVEKYRHHLISDEVKHKKEGQAMYLLSRWDRQKRVIAFTGSKYEGFMGIGLAVLAFWFYNISSYSLPLSLAITAVYVGIAIALRFLVASRYRTVAALLEEHRMPIEKSDTPRDNVGSEANQVEPTYDTVVT